MSGERAYRFGPLERGGVLLGLRWPQLGLLIARMACVLGALHSPPLVAVGWVLTAATLCLVAFARIQDRNFDQWLPILYGFTMQKVTGTRCSEVDHSVRRPTRRRSPRWPCRGRCHGWSSSPSRPAPATTSRWKDTRRRTYTAVLQVRGSQFALLESGEQQQRVDT